MSRRRGAGVGQKWGAGRQPDARFDDGAGRAHAASPSGGQVGPASAKSGSVNRVKGCDRSPKDSMPRCTSARGRRIVDPTLRPEEER